LPDDRIQSIAIDKNGTKWIGTWGGLAAYNEDGIPFGISESVKNEHLVKIYPNPVSDYVNIERLSTANISLIELINIQGKLVKHQKIKTGRNTIMDVRGLPKGLYMLRLHMDTGIVNEKLIKE
jgi:ligand-binding sensor domain-containing protein